VALVLLAAVGSAVRATKPETDKYLSWFVSGGSSK
jgi:hypothetical protein